jgi:rhodanese-related sulfurtransferase
MATKDPREPFTRIDVREAKELLDSGKAALIDVREQHEYDEAHVEGSTLIPVNSIFNRAGELPADKELVFICRTGSRSALAAEMAAAVGATNPLYNLEGGIVAWVEAGEPVE